MEYFVDNILPILTFLATCVGVLAGVGYFQKSRFLKGAQGHIYTLDLEIEDLRKRNQDLKEHLSKFDPVEFQYRISDLLFAHDATAAEQKSRDYIISVGEGVGAAVEAIVTSALTGVEDELDLNKVHSLGPPCRSRK